MGQKILITGSNGLLGQKLVHLLHDQKDVEVIATSRGENRIELIKGFVYEPLDITDAKAVATVMEKHAPDVVIHTAAMTNVDQCEEDREGCVQLNVEATRNIVNACEVQDSFLVHLSTDFIFDGEDGPYNEEAKPNPVSFYGETKLESEELVQQSKLRWAIVRTVLVFGISEKMSRSNIILWVKKSVEEGKTINVVNDQWRTPTLAEDLAKGCFLIATKKAEGIFNISGNELLTPYDMAMQTAEYFNLDKSYINETDGSKFQQKAKRPPKTGFDITKAQREVGYRPRTFKEGIAMVEQQLGKLV